jgi:hypothetical protein
MKVRLLSLGALLVACGVAMPASAQTTPSAPTFDIDQCTVKRSRNAGGFTWAYCPIVLDNPGTGNVSVQYSSNLTPFDPGTGSDWSKKTGTIRLGQGASLQSVKFAFRKLSASQVVRRLKVTLSNPTGGATITDTTATAKRGTNPGNS